MSTTEYTVTGMTCGHCEMSVREEVSEVPGVQDVQVSHETGRLTVAGTDDVSTDAVIAAVEEAGYTAARA
ncbi:heavy-metal-associated domain-containing protein [Kytococcus sedentarius]|uniref:heavy-metal-associated domain-containing protein n=1 Tax=Kytococcus sedentarius TaxID=1276 RepID=UPI0035BBF617